MKSIFFRGFLSLACLFALRPAVARTNSMEGLSGHYTVQNDENDGYSVGSIDLVLTPDSIFIVSSFGNLEFGTWTTFKNYLILEPNLNWRDPYYLFSYRNDAVEERIFRFFGFDDRPTAYSFDNDDLSQLMEPVLDSYSDGLLSPYKFPDRNPSHCTFQLAPYIESRYERATVYQGREFYSDHLPVYCYDLPEEENEIWVFVNKRASVSLVPILLLMENGRLKYDRILLAKKEEYSEMEEDELRFVGKVADSFRNQSPEFYFPEVTEEEEIVPVGLRDKREAEIRIGTHPLCSAVY